MSSAPSIPLPAAHALRKLGRDLALSLDERRRRQRIRRPRAGVGKSTEGVKLPPFYGLTNR